MGDQRRVHRYDGSLREQMAGKITADRTMKLFTQILDGVEAAHLLGVTHRDLKPENFLFDRVRDALAVADFGIASFTKETLLTMVKTGPTRLANFMYARAEARGGDVTARADIYALGLMLNEMFTGEVPHGTDFRTIEAIAEEFGFLDEIVAGGLEDVYACAHQRS